MHSCLFLRRLIPMSPSTYLATEDIHSLTSAFDTDTLMIVLSAYFLAAAALKAWEIDSSNPKQESALLAVVSSRLPLLTCLVVREQKRFTLTNFNISTIFINLRGSIRRDTHRKDALAPLVAEERASTHYTFGLDVVAACLRPSLQLRW